MKKTYIWNGTAFVEKKRTESKSHFVHPDIPDFKGADGVHISGRRQWRDHLKATGAVEMGIQDMVVAQDKWRSRKSDFQERVKKAEKYDVKPVEVHEDSRPTERSMITKELLNRLDGRPTPDRKTILKLSLDIARQMDRRR